MISASILSPMDYYSNNRNNADYYAYGLPVQGSYALYSTSANPRYAYDLKTGKVIPYSEFDAAFNKIKQ